MLSNSCYLCWFNFFRCSGHKKVDSKIVIFDVKEPENYCDLASECTYVNSNMMMILIFRKKPSVTVYSTYFNSHQVPTRVSIFVVSNRDDMIWQIGLVNDMTEDDTTA